MPSKHPTTPDISVHDEIGQMTLFRGLSKPDWQRILEQVNGKIFSANTSLMTAEQPGEAVYFIASGTVKVHVEQADGRDVLISILGPGEVVGEMSVFESANRSASVHTLETSKLYWADRATFQVWLKTVPLLSFNLADILAARLRQANEQIQSLAAFDTEGRVARQLVAFAEKYGLSRPNDDIYIPIRLTQSDIAALVGATREHTNKILVSYKERGFISANQSYHVTVHNLQALANRCH